MKKPTPLQVKAVWDSTVNPTGRKVAAILERDGYEITYRTVSRYKDANWMAQAKKAEKSLVIAKKAIAKKEVAEGDLDVTALVQRRLKRIDDLYLNSVAKNQAALQQAGLIAGIIVAEEMVAMIEQLTLEAPGDVARLLHAITEASQVKHVGGAGQVPESGDSRVIDHEPATKNPVSEALSRFRKNAGLA